MLTIPDLILTKNYLERIEKAIIKKSNLIYESEPRFIFNDDSLERFKELLNKFRKEINL